MTAQRDREWAAYKSVIVDTANRVGAEMAGCGIEAVRLLVAAHDVAFGAWQDKAAPDGVDILLIKGHEMMREAIASGETRRVTLTAIPCTCAEEAEALRRVVGEKDAKH